MKKIEKGHCVMCNGKGEYLAEETDELLCSYCWGVNEELREKNK